MAVDKLELGIDEERPDLSINDHSSLDDFLNGTKFTAEVPKRRQDPTVVVSKSPHTAEQRRYLGETVETALPNVRKAFEKVGVVIPSDSEILSEIIMTNRFTREQVWALMRTIEVPGLIVLSPEMKSFEDYLRLLSVNWKRSVHYTSQVGPDKKAVFAEQYRRLAAGKGQPVRYKFGVGEMVQEPENRRGNLRDIVGEWEGSDLAKLMRASTFRECAVLRAQASDYLDLEGWTMLAEENHPHSIIGKGGIVSGISSADNFYGFRGFKLKSYKPKDQCGSARIRPVVVG